MVFIFAGCDTGTETKDTWSAITSLHQLQGTWEGTTQTKPIPLKDIVEASGLLEDPDLLAELLGSEYSELIPPEMMINGIKVLIKDINVTITVKATITFVADAYDAGSMSGTADMTVSLSGGNTDQLWTMIMGIYEDMLPPDVDIDNNKHSITRTSDVPVTPITLDDFEGSQINQTGKKLRTELDTSALEEFDEIGVFESFVPSEIILYKK